MTDTAPEPPKIAAASARVIAAAEQRVIDAEAVVTEAKEKRDAVRERYRGQLPLGVDVRGGRFVIRRSSTGGGESFSLKDFRAAGGVVTKAMAPFVKLRGKGERWYVTETPTDPPAKV